MVTPQFGQLSWPRARRGVPATAEGSRAPRQNAPEHCQQRGFAAAREPHQQGQSTAAERQTDAVQGRARARPFTKPLYHIDGFEQWFVHCRNATAGSMRSTFTMAAVADRMHIRTVSRKRPNVSPGVMTIGNEVSAVDLTTTKPMHAARPKPMTALSNAG